ncbi:MAG: WD40/YVTN/BNR-like repeat-containing protein, partial [Vicinamibacterales bacterium]
MRKLLLLTVTACAVIVFGDARSDTLALAQSNPNVVVNPNTYRDLRWRSIGPTRGGRSTAATGVRTQPNVFYMGATGGGVWKTDNFGITWTPISDGQIPTGSIGALDVADSNPNIIYAGTGSEAIRSNVIVGRGVYKSVDAGKTWQYAGLKEVGQIGQLKVHPKNPDIAYVAAIGQPFGWGPARGVYRTKDGGKTWQKVLFINDQTGVVSVAINWQNPNEVYAGAWRGQRKPWTIISGGPAAEGGVYKTTDGGDHWSRLSSGFPDDLIGKVWVDIAQSDPKVVYAQVEAKGAKGGLYRTADAGASWTLVNSSQSLRARPFYFNKVFVSPKDENDVWVSELNFHHSTDGGRTFVNVNTPHGDNHVVWFNPDQPHIFIETNDGGANITQDNGRSWSSINNQPTAEMYMVDADEQF